MAVREVKDIYTFLRDSAGSNDAARDFSGALDGTFKYVPDKNCVIERVIVQIKDTLINSADQYGGIAALTNGIRVRVRDIEEDEVILDLVNEDPPKTNGEWAKVCFDVDYTPFAQGEDYVDVRWTFGKSSKPLFLYEGEQLEVFIDENLSGLTAHTFFIMGQER